MLGNVNISICWQSGAVEENGSFTLQGFLQAYAAQQIFTDTIKTHMKVMEV